MRTYFIKGHTGISQVFTKTIRSNDASDALNFAEVKAAENPDVLFTVSNDRGRNLAAFQGGEYRYLGL